jgi:hypothetical protein
MPGSGHCGSSHMDHIQKFFYSRLESRGAKDGREFRVDVGRRRAVSGLDGACAGRSLAHFRFAFRPLSRYGRVPASSPRGLEAAARGGLRLPPRVIMQGKCEQGLGDFRSVSVFQANPFRWPQPAGLAGMVAQLQRSSRLSLSACTRPTPRASKSNKRKPFSNSNKRKPCGIDAAQWARGRTVGHPSPCDAHAGAIQRQGDNQSGSTLTPEGGQAGRVT